mmetsp:Transcript_4732/g.14160  ORF Transcript_4732/g.14160 Transcript_4732/m.14160 type:complete len:243 (+) Transcript_4732:117-845(+)
MDFCNVRILSSTASSLSFSTLTRSSRSRSNLFFSSFNGGNSLSRASMSLVACSWSFSNFFFFSLSEIVFSWFRSASAKASFASLQFLSNCASSLSVLSFFRRSTFNWFSLFSRFACSTSKSPAMAVIDRISASLPVVMPPGIIFNCVSKVFSSCAWREIVAASSTTAMMVSLAFFAPSSACSIRLSVAQASSRASCAFTKSSSAAGIRFSFNSLYRAAMVINPNNVSRFASHSAIFLSLIAN